MSCGSRGMVACIARVVSPRTAAGVTIAPTMHVKPQMCRVTDGDTFLNLLTRVWNKTVDELATRLAMGVMEVLLYDKPAFSSSPVSAGLDDVVAESLECGGFKCISFVWREHVAGTVDDGDGFSVVSSSSGGSSSSGSSSSNNNSSPRPTASSGWGFLMKPQEQQVNHLPAVRADKTERYEDATFNGFLTYFQQHGVGWLRAEVRKDPRGGGGVGYLFTKELTDLMRITRSSAKILNEGKGIPLWLTPWAVKGRGRLQTVNMETLRLRVQLLRSMMAQTWATRREWKPLVSDVESFLQLLVELADRRDKEAVSQQVARASSTAGRSPEVSLNTDTIEVSHNIPARYQKLTNMILKLQDFQIVQVPVILVDTSFGSTLEAANSNARRQHRHRFWTELRLGCRALHVSYAPGACDGMHVRFVRLRTFMTRYPTQQPLTTTTTTAVTTPTRQVVSCRRCTFSSSSRSTRNITRTSNH